MSDTISPRRLRVSALNMSSGMSSPHIDTRSSRSALEVELVDKIDLNNDFVLRRLGVDQVPDDLDQNYLGQDPTASILSEASDEYKLAQDLAIANGLPPHASFSITMGGNDNRRWLTVGPSRWISPSLNGRGTSIWLVAEYKNRQLSSTLMVIKSAWRHDTRLAESTMYDLVQGSHPAIAKFHYGADVKLPDSSAVSVNNMMRGSHDSQENTPILHRLSLATVGRPIWSTRDDLQLFKGFRAALHGHKFLSDQNILHRDINADNILLSADASPVFGGEGFLIDLGAVISGTVQFMAVQVIAALINEQPIQQEVRHDIESFVWVLCYVTARRLVYQTLPSKISALEEKTKNKSDEMDAELEQLKSDRTQAFNNFHNYFGRTSLDRIETIRKSLQPISQLYEAPYAKRHLTETTRSLFKSITLMMVDHIHLEQIYLTYESLGKVFDTAIDQLMQ